MSTAVTSYAPGTRVLIRDEEWLVRRSVPSKFGGLQIDCEGISETVRDLEASFLDTIDEVTVLKPSQTKFEADESTKFIQSRLILEARLRQLPPQGKDVSIAEAAAMDVMDFQLEPAKKLLELPRPRFLIADATGLGKTLEAGIVTAELVRRGRARRILVVSTKGMMRQFQQEFWQRFTIPLIRLDSAGIKRIQATLPGGHNPFNYYDRTIISMDTLKQETYLHFLATTSWDLIIIDEAHNASVKQDGRLIKTAKNDTGGESRNTKLARLLSQRSDALLLLTATPHSGKRNSFASLIAMLDPTILPLDVKDLKPYQEDIKRLYLRRLRSTVQTEMRKHGNLPERILCDLKVKANSDEEAIFQAINSLNLQEDEKKLRERKTKGQGPTQESGTSQLLFRTLLFKSFLSSPQALLATLKTRLAADDKALLDAKNKVPATAQNKPRTPLDSSDRSALEALQRQTQALVAHSQTSKLAYVTDLLQGKHDPRWKWTGKDAEDRLIIFTERIETVKRLRSYLQEQLGLEDAAIKAISGSDSDTEIQDVVEEFGRSTSPLRLLIASDIASEGINLHYCAHRLIHFDLPWSLMVFQQRNGRIDRYGQTHQPLIGYLMMESGLDGVKSDLRVLEILKEKEQQLANDIGDASIFGTQDEQEQRTAHIIETSTTFASEAELGEALVSTRVQAEADGDNSDDVFGDFDFEGFDSQSDQAAAAPPPPPPAPSAPPTLFEDDFVYVREALRQLSGGPYALVHDFEANGQDQLKFQPGKRLSKWLERHLDKEMHPESNTFRLSSDSKTVISAIAKARDFKTWAQTQYLWPLHPVVQWLNVRLMTSLGRLRAPLFRAPRGLNPGESLIIAQYQVPNGLGKIELAGIMGVRLNAQFQPLSTLSFEELCALTGLNGDKGFINDGSMLSYPITEKQLEVAVKQLSLAVAPLRTDRFQALQATLKDQLAKLAERQKRFKPAPNFEAYEDWLRKAHTLAGEPQITLLAALVA